MPLPKKHAIFDETENCPVTNDSEHVRQKKVVVSPLECTSNKHLHKAALVYKALSKRGTKIFMQRNLIFRKRSLIISPMSSPPSKRHSNLKRKRLSPTLCSLEPSKRPKLDKLLEKSGTNVNRHEFVGRMQIILKDINDESRLFDDVDVEAFILKLDQNLNEANTISDGIATHKIGTFKVQGNSPKKSLFPSLPLVVDLPPDAFLPLNGHIRWSNWLVLRCTFNTNDDRQLRRLGHRKSSEWQNAPSSVRMATLPLCDSGVTPLTDGEFQLKFLWKHGKTDEQLIETIKSVFQRGHRTNNSSPLKVNGKNEHDSLYLTVEIRWHNDDTSSTTTNGGWPTVSFRRTVDDLIILKGLKQKKCPKKRKSNVPTSIFYRFVCSGSKNCAPCRLQTIVDDPSRCPFCSVWAEDIYFLLKHLRCFHFRFLFHHKQNNNKHIIEVRPNNNFDAADDVKMTTMIRFSKRKCRPTKNFQIGGVIFKKNGSKNEFVRNLDEFKYVVAPESPTSRRQKSFDVHKRDYYHSQTLMPLTFVTFDNDSEGEMAPEWLRKTRTKMIEEFSDVNLGEKKIMQLWNNHVVKFNYYGDNQIFVACQTFWDSHWRQILPEFYGNYSLHLQNLFASGILTQQQLFLLSTKVKATKLTMNQTKKT